MFEVKGSNLLAMLEQLAMSEQILAGPLAAFGLPERPLEPETWYAGEHCLALLDAIEERYGSFSARKVGAHIFARAEEPLREMGLDEPEQVLRAMPAAYRLAVRGAVEETGDWEVVQAHPGAFLVRETTPLNCSFAEGLLDGAVSLFRPMGTSVTHVQCRRTGAEACTFRVVWVPGMSC